MKRRPEMPGRDDREHQEINAPVGASDDGADDDPGPIETTEARLSQREVEPFAESDSERDGH